MSPPEDRLSSAYYSNSIAEFLRASDTEIVGALTTSSVYSVDPTQVTAWIGQLEILKPSLDGLDGFISLEFEVPRLASRVDAVVLSAGAVIPIEFKVGAQAFLRADEDQAWDYALDLKNFHRGSHDRRIFPLLVATNAARSDTAWRARHADGVHPPRHVNSAGVRVAIAEAIALADGARIDGRRWVRESYQPTPTIVQAARALYARHSVDAISRHDAGARNLRETSRAVEAIIESSYRDRQKTIVFVTGVPGAGKTLVGLNIATRHRRAAAEDPAHASFLSGNRPLVEVLREALVRDELRRIRRDAKGSRIDPKARLQARQEVKQFIHLVHQFRDEGLKSAEPPDEHVVVFDEAQRAWTREKTARFLSSFRRRHRITGFAMSEPEFHLSYLDRHKWAVAVCLVGGGQEIHDGEAGIGAWVDAIRDRFPHWRVAISSRLTDSEFGSGAAIARLSDHAQVTWLNDLHLSVSMRSFRAERVSEFVKALLDRDRGSASNLYSELRKRYPIVITRQLDRAKEWIRTHARGSERFGLVASSNAERLKPHAIDVRVPTKPVQWFLSDRDDTRSSVYLEDAATEFQVQGLELDWVCATWDADLRMGAGSEWLHRKFNGRRWNQVKKPELKRYQLNAYRVLLTRARQGMAIFVPAGDSQDMTRAPEYYDSTWAYLRSIGIEEI